jgi:hypothetical protein
VVDAVEKNYGLTLTRQHVYCYDPKSSQRLAPRWKEIHAATRQAYLREVAEIGVAQKAFRLAMLDRMAHDAMTRDNFSRAAEILEQAAKECGGIYENRRPVVLQLGAEPPSLPPRNDAVIEATPLPQLPDRLGPAGT